MKPLERFLVERWEKTTYALLLLLIFAYLDGAYGSTNPGSPRRKNSFYGSTAKGYPTMRWPSGRRHGSRGLVPSGNSSGLFHHFNPHFPFSMLLRKVGFASAAFTPACASASFSKVCASADNFASAARVCMCMQEKEKNASAAQFFIPTCTRSRNSQHRSPLCAPFLFASQVLARVSGLEHRPPPPR